jgi:glucose/arabinose dehydrogenase
MSAGLWGCRSESTPNDPPVVDPSDMSVFCNLPGSLRFESDGPKRVAGGDANSESVSFVHLPPGYCAHYYGTVGNTRQLRFAPGGELFVASPTTVTTGGGRLGRSAIVVLPDDDGDGTADTITTFLEGLPSTQGMMFADGYFYYQDDNKILRMPYAKAQRSAAGESEVMATVDIYHSGLHWPKPIDQADDGTIYIGNGGDQDENCDTTRPFHGGILRLDGSPGGTPISNGFRNPIAIRCERGHNVCLAAELAMDYSAGMGGREKLVPIREGDDLGFPCCQTQDIPASNADPVPDCSRIAPEDVSFVIGDTPFSFDFERGVWSAPYRGSVFVPLHGEAGTWKGARVVAIDVNPDTGLPLAATNLPGVSPGGMRDFVTGWDDGSRLHGRPAAVEFSSDGRMFVGNDNDGVIFWVAPLELRRHAP